MTDKKTIEINGRKYLAYVSPEDSGPPGAFAVIGPPEGLVDNLELPEPFATSLHNILYDRGLFTYKDVTQNPKALQGALQEAMKLDVQKLSQAYFTIENETEQVSGGI